ncbi:MAG TPA: glutamine--fructose-6-phosphate aminotransferase, partial [Microbacterium sp.]|nr:glutamine--fructose-6-phosphate aminotransferase [Microbacterium sp.]
QSGETMDTLMAVKFARERGAKTLSICNTQGATIPRESDAIVYTHAGPEVAVASTKAFVAQITALYLLALHIGQVRGAISADEVAAQIEE